MLELFEKAGYIPIPFSENADIYVINTCTVTGTGDKKSLQLIRRIKRLHPQSELIVTGCLAQRLSDTLIQMGARLVIGTQNRSHVVSLFEQAIAQNIAISAVKPLDNIGYEPLAIHTQQEKTRAVLKIQEGCDKHCSYCIIPSVRGPIRSRKLAEVIQEADTLSAAGHAEIVLTGIHLSSYGRDFKNGTSLKDVILSLNTLPHVKRIRIGSLEPNLINETFVNAIATCEKLCPQFHLSLQSGSNAVLKRMGRGYNLHMYQQAISLLREKYPLAAFTTDIIAGFPGETEDEHQETLTAVKHIGFAKIHVFPYSLREGTKAALLPNHIAKPVKDRRAKEIASIASEMARSYQRKFLGTLQPILFETYLENGLTEGYSREYIRVEVKNATPGTIENVLITGENKNGLIGHVEQCLHSNPLKE